MKILMKKIKASNKGMKFFYFFTFIAYLVSYIFFFRSMLILTGIENVLRTILLIVFCLYGLLYLLMGLTSLIEKKKKVFIPLTIIALLLTVFFGVASYYINRIYKAIDQFSQKEVSTYTTVLLTMKDTEFTSDSKIGMIDNETNRENYILPKEMMKKENITNEITYYNDINVLVASLYNKEVDAIFISKDYPVLMGNEEKYQNIVNETQVVKSYSKEMKTEESQMVTTKNLTEPFSVLVLGVDSESTEALNPNAAFNGDTLMLLTFNPKTLNATIFSVPRDLYVPISCNNNRFNKVNASAYGGTSCVIDTVENLTDVEIDYFVKVDFKAVVDLVEAMGGIDVEVEAPDYKYYIQAYGGRLCEQNSLRQFGEHLICMDTGMQHLNGEQALAYARNRHGYLESDIARNRHQQQVIEAMAKKLVTTASFGDFEMLLDTISKHIATNMKTSQILSFYQAIKNMLGSALSGGDFITIQKTQLTYYNLNVGGMSALGYYQGSMDAITRVMKENLGEVKTEDIKTFAYDYTKDYERSSEVIGKGIYKGSKMSFMPNFVGDSVSKAKNFATTNDLSLNIIYVNEPDEVAGIIVRQSVTAGTDVSNISGFTIYVNNPTVDDEDDKESSDDDEKNNDEETTGEDKNDDESSNNDNGDTKPDDDKDEESSKPPVVPGTPETPDDSENGDTSTDNEEKPVTTPEE